MAVVAVTACASSLPPNFEYKTSLRGEQGFIGTSQRVNSAESILSGGLVTDPALALRTALPDANVTVRKWGLRYFDSDWARYQIVLDVDVERGKDAIKCREVSSVDPAGAPTLTELTAGNGIELQRQLDTLVAACVGQFKDLT